MLISPKQANRVQLGNGDGEAIGPLKENISSRRINAARVRRVAPSRVRQLVRIGAWRGHRHRISAPRWTPGGPQAALIDQAFALNSDPTLVWESRGRVGIYLGRRSRVVLRV